MASSSIGMVRMTIQPFSDQPNTTWNPWPASTMSTARNAMYMTQVMTSGRIAP